MLRWYQAKLASRPLATQAITTAILFATGDTMAQQLVDKKGLRNQDLARTGRMFLYGGAVFGPVVTKWLGALDKHVRIPGRPNAELLTRVGLDQLVFAPVIIGVFLTSMAAMEGTSPQEKLEANYTTAVTKNWMLWPMVQLGNFKYVPLQYRVLTANIVSLGWNCYLSYLNNQSASIEPSELEKRNAKNPDMTWS